MAFKFTKFGVAWIPGIVDIVEDYLAVEPTYVHVTRGIEFGAGLVGSLLTGKEGLIADATEALMLSSEPLFAKTLYSLFTGAVEGQPSKEDIELKLRRAGRTTSPQLKKPRFH